MKLSTIIKIIGKEYNGEDININSVKTDSRNIKKGDLFICINNGYNYIDDAIKNGCIAVIVDKEVPNKSIPIIRVEDTIKSLGLIAKHIRSLYKGVVIAITGSNGKTTTKEILSYLLSSKYKVLKNNGSENNSIGLPNALLSLDNKYDYAVFELGTNHMGEIEYLADIVKPNIAIITNIGNAHIGNFKTKDNILKEKSMIAKGTLKTYVNGDDEYLAKTDFIKVYSKDYNLDNKQNISNYALAYKVCQDLGMKISELDKIIDNMPKLESRMDEIIVNNVTIIDDAFNASYESILSGLDYIKKFNNKIIIIGDMLELGHMSEKLHKQLYDKIKLIDNHILITYGKETKVMNNELSFDTHDEIVNYLKTISFDKDDVIYLKGAHSMHLSNLVSPIIELLEDKYEN